MSPPSGDGFGARDLRGPAGKPARDQALLCWKQGFTRGGKTMRSWSPMKSQWICNFLRFNLIICCMYGVRGRNLEKDDAHDVYIYPWSMSARFMELLNKISLFQTSTPQQPLVMTLGAPVTWLIFGSSPWEDLRGTLQDHPRDWSGLTGVLYPVHHWVNGLIMS